MTGTITKKYPFWVDGDSYLTTLACHFHVELLPVAKTKKNIFWNVYKYTYKGRKQNILDFEKEANVTCVRKTTKSMSMRRKILGRTNR